MNACMHTQNAQCLLHTHKHTHTHGWQLDLVPLEIGDADHVIPLSLQQSA